MKRRQRREEKEAAMREQVDSVFGQWESEDERDELQAAELTDSVSANIAATLAQARENLRVKQQPIAISRAALSEVNPSIFDKCETTTGLNERRKRWRRGIAIFALMLMAMVCALPRLSGLLGDKLAHATVPSTASNGAKPQSRLLTKPIEEIRCGDRIPSQLPEGVDSTVEEVPNSDTWRLVELEVSKKNGEKVEVKLLRPMTWLEEIGAITEGKFELNVREMDLASEAAVLRVSPSPPIQSGDGQVVTGTFHHMSDSFVELSISGEAETITCTTGHPIWSETRKTFVDAVQLKQDESVYLWGGELAKIADVRRIHGRKQVFNLEINISHVYHVGQSGILVHNSLAKCDADDEDSRSKYVIVDTNKIGDLKSDPTLGGLIAPDEIPVISYVSGPEARNAAARSGGKYYVPSILSSLTVLQDRPDIDRVIDVRGRGKKKKGGFGDGIIGGQALELMLPLITNDKELAKIVSLLGGKVRVAN